jgi:DDE family transposase
MDCKATVSIGEYSRGGKTRGDNRAADHDMGCEQKYTPFGLVDEDSGQLHLTFGSSFKTSDFIVDGLYAWWERLPMDERDNLSVLQIKADNGPESNGRRTPFLKRMVEFADHIGKPVQLLYYPPYPSQIQSGGALLGHSRAALERCQAGECGDDARMGQEHDLERYFSGGRAQPHDLPEGCFPVETGHARGRVPPGTEPTPAQMGHPYSACLMGFYLSEIT